MDFSHYSRAPVDLAVALANTSPHPYDEPDDLATVADLRAFLEREVPFGPEHGWGALSEQDVREVRRLRDELVAVFLAPTEEAAAAALNRLLVEFEVVPHVSRHDGKPWHLHYVRPGASPARVMASAAGMALATVLCESGIGRLGYCSSDRCKDFYVDTSKNSSRRYCSDKCSNRAGVQAYRARRRAEEQMRRAPDGSEGGP